MRKFIKIIIVIAIIINLGFFVQTDYYLVSPGSTENLGNMVQVENAEDEGGSGFYLVTTTQQRANAFLFLYGLVNPHADLRQRKTVIPPDMSPQEYRELMQNWMDESQLLAQIIALRRSGYEVEIISEGIEIVEFDENSPAEDILQKGDIIKSVNNVPVTLADEVVSMVQNHPVGEPVNLAIQRDDGLVEVEVPTTTHSEEPDKAALRVFIRTMSWEAELPIGIEIDAGPIGGPSAGLMFVLEIMDQLSPDDLTGGYLIAGTGTINIDETIGSIGGVKQKVVAAERDGADYFFVPDENFAIAEKKANNINVVPVKDLEEVLQFLHSVSL